MEGSSLILFEILNGVAWGLVLALIALGLGLIYGLMGIINLAHGSLYMLGAVLGVYLARTFGLNFWLMLLAAPLAVAALGVVINHLLFERVVHRNPTIGLLATAGLLLVIDNSVLMTFGGSPESVVSPIPGAVQLAGFYYPTYRLVAAVIALAVLVAMWAFLRFTRYGLWMRAVPQGRELAAAIGVPIARVNRLTVALAGAVAGFAGALITPISAAHFQMGLQVLASAFIIVVVGGLGNLFGAAIVAILFGIIRGLFTVVLTPNWAEVASLVVLLPVLYFRPNGIFGKR